MKLWKDVVIRLSALDSRKLDGATAAKSFRHTKYTKYITPRKVSFIYWDVYWTEVEAQVTRFVCEYRYLYGVNIMFCGYVWDSQMNQCVCEYVYNMLANIY